jgi:hypothetical protein
VRTRAYSSRALGGAARLVAAALVWAAVISTAGCSTRDPGSSPEAAVQSLIAAARAGDRLAVYQRLGPRTRARIDDLLSSARRTGATRVLRPEDLVTVGWVPPAWEAAGTRLLHREGDDAEVEVYSGGGDRQSVRVVREAKSWKVELPLR